MREYSVPATITVDPADNLTDTVLSHARDAPEAVLFARRLAGGWQDVTAREFADQVATLAKGLIASGIGPGDRVAIMSKTRYEWTLADYAIWMAGAVSVPIYETSSAEQVEWILTDSEAVALIAETADHLATYDAVAAAISTVRTVWQIDAGDLDRLAERGQAVSDAELDKRRHSCTADSLATIIYTSGTTGRPKGCELSHRNFLFDARTTTDGLAELFTDDASTLLFLPLAHSFARLIQVGAFVNRVRVGHTADPKNLLADLASFQPTFVLSVPRVFEKVHNTAKTRAHADGKGRIFDLAESVAIRWSQARDRGRPGVVLATQHALFDRLVYTRLRAALGGRVRYAVSGGAPLGARLGHFFRGVGVTILEGYGLTETCAAATVNLPATMRIGTVGQPIPGTQVRIGDDGEVLLRGPNVFRGYWRNEAATKESMEPEGWFHTGDIGELDADGFLRITGRKKELIVTAGGKNVAPAVLEDRLRAHALISQCMVVGDQRPFIGCLVTLDPDAFATWKREHDRPADATVGDLRDDPALRSAVQEAVDEANRAVSRAEGIRAFRILPVDFTEEGGQLTPTLKLRRAVVATEFAADIEALYAR